MPILAGCPTIGSARCHGPVADLQDSPANERFSGMDLLRHKICPGAFIEDGYMDMLENSQKNA